MQRIVEPEILDSLPIDDPEACRSRADLKWVNRFMGGEKWICKQVEQMDGVQRVIELGAGMGALATRLKRTMEHLEVVAVDLIDKPSEVPDEIEWKTGDLFEMDLKIDECTVVVSNLFLHHFKREQLLELGERVADAKAVLVAEPDRSLKALYLGRLILPFVGRVTRYDMMVSIRAGFQKGEIPHFFNKSMDWQESHGCFGGLRSKGVNL